MKFACPNCQTETPIGAGALFRENTLVVSLFLPKGHHVEAATLGSMISHTAGLLKDSASHFGVNAYVAVSDVRFSGREIQIDFVTMEVRPAKTP